MSPAAQMSIAYAPRLAHSVNFEFLYRRRHEDPCAAPRASNDSRAYQPVLEPWSSGVPSAHWGRTSFSPFLVVVAILRLIQSSRHDDRWCIGVEVVSQCYDYSLGCWVST